MKTSIFTIPIALAGIVLLTACDSESNEQKDTYRYANLFVRYLDGENELKATASFLEGNSLDSAKTYIPEQGIFFQGEEMKGRKLPGGTRYIVEKIASYTTPFIFSSSFMPDFKIDMLPIDSFSVQNGQCSISRGLKLFVDHPPETTESLVLFFSDANNKAYTILVEGPLTDGNISIKSEELKRLQPGPHELYLVKKKKFTEDKEEVSVLANIEYYTLPVKFEVVE